jgi:hypothetical protein
MTQEVRRDDAVEPAGSDDALAAVRALGDVPTAEHVGRFEDVERLLRARLDGAPDGATVDGGTEH